MNVVRRKVGRWPIPRLTMAALVPVVVGVVVCVEARTFFGPAAREPALASPRFLVARSAVEPGQPITAIEFTLSHGTDGEKPPPDALTDQELHLLRGATTRTALGKGDYLTRSLVRFPLRGGHLGAAVPRGKRAYRLRAEGAMDARPGDRIDVFLSPEGTGDDPVTLAEGLLVLREGEDGGIVVAASSGDIRVLEQAKRRGPLAVLLRNPNDPLPEGVGEGRRSLGRPPPAPQIRILTEAE